MKFFMALVATVLLGSAARAEDGRMCVHYTLKNPSALELIAAVQKECHEDDVLFISNINARSGSFDVVPPFVAAAV